MVLYPGELEEAFNRFTDLAQTFALHRGKGSRDPEEKSGQPVGYFKGSLKAYPLPDDGSPMPELILSNIPSTDPVEVIVRIYIIKVRGSLVRTVLATGMALSPATAVHMLIVYVVKS